MHACFCQPYPTTSRHIQGVGAATRPAAGALHEFRTLTHDASEVNVVEQLMVREQEDSLGKMPPPGYASARQIVKADFVSTFSGRESLLQEDTMSPSERNRFHEKMACASFAAEWKPKETYGDRTLDEQQCQQAVEIDQLRSDQIHYKWQNQAVITEYGQTLVLEAANKILPAWSFESIEKFTSSVKYDPNTEKVNRLGTVGVYVAMLAIGTTDGQRSALLLCHQRGKKKDMYHAGMYLSLIHI